MKNNKIEQKVLNDIERSYELTISDIYRYIRQAGTITIDVVKRLIRWNYFRNEDVVDLRTHEYNSGNYAIVAMDMFDLELWLTENYGIEIEELENIEDELSFYTSFGVRLN